MTYEIWDKTSSVNGVEAIDIIGHEQMANDDVFVLFKNESNKVIAIESVSTMKTSYGFTGTTVDEIVNEYIELNNPAKIKEEQYGARVVELIRVKYSADDEFDLQNNVTDALATGAPELPADYIAYRTYVETCKDTAYREVYGIERP